MKKRIIFFSIVILLLLGFFFILNKNTLKQYSEKFTFFNKNCEITIYSKENKTKKLNEIIDKMQKLELKYSNELESINSKSGKIKVSSNMYGMIKLVNDYELLWNYNSLIEVWKNNLENSKIPTNNELSDFKNSSKIELLDNSYLESSNFDLNLDMIIPTYIIEKINDYLKDESYMINYNGNVSVGKHYEDKFNIALYMPVTNQYFKTITGNNINVYNIGMSDNSVIDGISYTPLIDFTTKYPYQKHLSVSVISNDFVESSLIAYKLYTLSLEDGKEYLKNQNVTNVIWVENDQTVVTLNA